MNRWIGSYRATDAETKIASTTASPARFSPRKERRKKVIPSGIAVRASPKLRIRSARRETEPEMAKDRHLRHSSEPEHGKADRDGFDTLVRADDRSVNEPVRVVVVVDVLVVVCERLRPVGEDEMAVSTAVRGSYGRGVHADARCRHSNPHVTDNRSQPSVVHGRRGDYPRVGAGRVAQVEARRACHWACITQGG
jgi:hypothetical protein